MSDTDNESTITPATMADTDDNISVTSAMMSDTGDEISITSASEEPQTLKDDIEALIAPYCYLYTKPPFSAAELTVMAVVCTQEGPCPNNDGQFANCGVIQSVIMRWIVETFAYYASEALEQYAKRATERWNGPEPLPLVVEGFFDTFSCFEAPLSEPDLGITVQASHIETVIVCENQGRIFLRKWLEPKRTGVFPFLKLPAEVCNSIYEMVLSFPKSGFSFTTERSGKPRFLLLEREDGELFESEMAWPNSLADSEDRKITPPRNMLALLGVNKQLRTEATPFFYRNNKFFFPRINHCVAFLTGTPASQLKHLGQLQVNLTHIENASVGDVMEVQRAIKAIRSLKALSIFAEGLAWLGESGSWPRGYHMQIDAGKIKQMPGVEILISLGAKVPGGAWCVNIESEIRAYIEGESERIQDATNNVTKA